MGSPVVHFEVRSPDPDASRTFYGKLFGWTFPDGGMPGYTYVDTGALGALPGGISPLQGGDALVTFFVGVNDVTQTLKDAVAHGGRIVQPATAVPGVTFGLFADPQGQVVGLAAPDTQA
jgi:predicted enzyme related to lactoylglutathione lyase